MSVTFDVFDEKTDHLEANAISVEMFEAYFCPFFASMLLAVNPEYVVSEDTQFIVNFFFYGQIIQVIGFSILNFTIPFRYLGNPLRNKYMPGFLFGLTYFVFMFVPIAKSLVYMFFLYRTSLIETVAGPWLLLCTSNCIVIIALWWSDRVLVVVESQLESVALERRWEKERIEKAELAKSQGKRMAKSLGINLLLNLGSSTK